MSDESQQDKPENSPKSAADKPADGPGPVTGPIDGGDPMIPAPAGPSGGATFETLLADVPVEMSVELGRVVMSLKDVSGHLGPGSVIPLAKLTGDKLDVRVNQRLVARAEAVAIGDRYGARIVEIVRGDGGGQ